jgi:hypothetical protein
MLFQVNLLEEKSLVETWFPPGTVNVPKTKLEHTLVLARVKGVSGQTVRQ